MHATINDSIASAKSALLSLSKSSQSRLCRKARAYIADLPGCADHSTFWRGLSARQVVETIATQRA